MGFFGRNRKSTGKMEYTREGYDKEKQQPALRCSICTGEQVAGFLDIHTGDFAEVMLIRNEADLELFKSRYEINGDIRKIY